MKTILRLTLALSLLAGAPAVFAYMTPGEAFGIGAEVIAPSALTAQAASTGRVFYRNGQPVLQPTPPIPAEPSAPPVETAPSSSDVPPHDAAPTETGAIDAVGASGAVLPTPELPAAETGSEGTETAATGGGFSAMTLLTALPLWQIILIAVALVAVPFHLFSRRRRKAATLPIGDNQPLGAPVVAQPPEESSARLEQALKSLETSAPQVPVSSPTELAVLPPKETPSAPSTAQPMQQTIPAQPTVQPTSPTEAPATVTPSTQESAVTPTPAETVVQPTPTAKATETTIPQSEQTPPPPASAAPAAPDIVPPPAATLPQA